MKKHPQWDKKLKVIPRALSKKKKEARSVIHIVLDAVEYLPVLPCLGPWGSLQ